MPAVPQEGGRRGSGTPGTSSWTGGRYGGREGGRGEGGVSEW